MRINNRGDPSFKGAKRRLVMAPTVKSGLRCLDNRGGPRDRADHIGLNMYLRLQRFVGIQTENAEGVYQLGGGATCICANPERVSNKHQMTR